MRQWIDGLHLQDKPKRDNTTTMYHKYNNCQISKHLVNSIPPHILKHINYTPETAVDPFMICV